MWENCWCETLWSIHWLQPHLYTLVFTRMLNWGLLLLQAWESFRWIWAKQNLELIWNFSSLCSCENDQIPSFCWHSQQFTPPQSWPTSLSPRLHAWLPHNVQPVSPSIMSTLCPSNRRRSQTSGQAIIYLCHLLLFCPRILISTRRNCADLFEGSCCTCPPAMQYFPLERDLWKWRMWATVAFEFSFFFCSPAQLCVNKVIFYL